MPLYFRKVDFPISKQIGFAFWFAQSKTDPSFKFNLCKVLICVKRNGDVRQGLSLLTHINTRQT